MVAEFNKLRQTDSVLAYQEQFEELRALMLVSNNSLSEQYFISSFISGLKEEIKFVVQMFLP